MSVADYVIGVDLNDNGTFTDQSAHVRSAHWRVGFSHQYESVAPLSKLEVVLDNQSVNSIQLLDTSGDGVMDKDNWTPGNTTLTNPSVGILRILDTGVNSNIYALQNALTVGIPHRYIGEARSDGVNTGARLYDGSGYVWTGTISTDWQPFDLISTPTVMGYRVYGSDGDTGSHVEFRKLKVYKVMSPEMLAHHRIRIQWTVPTPDATLFLGFIDFAEVSDDGLLMTLHCVGLEASLWRTRIQLPYANELSAAEIIVIAQDLAPARPGILYNVLQLNHATDGVLGKVLTSDNRLDRILTRDKTPYPVVGDRWVNRLAIDIIRDAIASVGGRYWADRTGRMQFWDKLSLIVETEELLVDADLPIMSALETKTGVAINEMTVSFVGRETGSVDTTLWSLSEPLLIRAGKERSITCRFRDQTTKQAIGASQVDAMLPTTNYFANIDNTLTTNTHTPFISVDLIEQSGGSQTFLIYHTQPFDLYLGKFTITGTPVIPADPATVKVTDWELATEQGIVSMNVNAPLLVNSVLAEDLARYEIARAKYDESTFAWFQMTLGELGGADVPTVMTYELQINATDYLDKTLKAYVFAEEYWLSATEVPRAVFECGHGWWAFNQFDLLELDGDPADGNNLLA